MSGQCRQADLEALRDGRGGELPRECVPALLHWLCGARSGEAATAHAVLGDPQEHPERVRRVYHALDRWLFVDTEVIPPYGGADERRARFRLLSRAYHPDRYPDLVDWLGPRAQSVNAAYTAFRAAPADWWETPVDSSAGDGRGGSRDGNAAGRGVVNGGPPPGAGRAKPPAARPREWLMRALAPLAGTRFLPQKILALTALVCGHPHRLPLCPAPAAAPGDGPGRATGGGGGAAGEREKAAGTARRNSATDAPGRAPALLDLAMVDRLAATPWPVIPAAGTGAGGGPSRRPGAGCCIG
ncbi:MAG: hypothetical protein U5L11_03680 [Arhodomonas sp.]|nr:hypothetical protein [Arhodomonas sp.]